MAEYRKCPIPLKSAKQLAAAFVKTEVDGSGKVSSKEFWNHARGGYEPGPRVDSKHLLPLERLSDDAADVDNTTHFLFVPSDAVREANVTVHVYEVDAQGVATNSLYEPMTRNYVYALSGLDS